MLNVKCLSAFYGNKRTNKPLSLSRLYPKPQKDIKKKKARVKVPPDEWTQGHRDGETLPKLLGCYDRKQTRHVIKQKLPSQKRNLHHHQQGWREKLPR